MASSGTFEAFRSEGGNSCTSMILNDNVWGRFTRSIYICTYSRDAWGCKARHSTSRGLTGEARIGWRESSDFSGARGWVLR